MIKVSEKRFYLYLFALLLILGTLFSGCARSPAEDVVARVNSKAITRQELDDFKQLIYLYMPGLEELSREQEQVASLEQEVLWMLIEHSVLEQEVERLSLELEPQALEQGFRQLRADLIELIYETEEQYLDRLRELQLSESQLHLLSRSTLWRELLYRHVTAAVTEDDARQFVQENPSFLQQPATVYAYRILLESEQEAREVLRLLEQGADFVETGEAYSREGFVELGQVSATDMLDPLFMEAAFHLTPGEISRPVKTEQGYYIIMITEKKEASTLDFAQVKTEAMNVVKEEKYAQYFQQLIQDSNIETFKEKK